MRIVSKITGNNDAKIVFLRVTFLVVIGCFIVEGIKMFDEANDVRYSEISFEKYQNIENILLKWPELHSEFVDKTGADKKMSNKEYDSFLFVAKPFEMREQRQKVQDLRERLLEKK